MASEDKRTFSDLESDTSGSENDDEPPAKKAKVRTGPFAVKGDCDDEVTLRFDDGEELYVSKGFLGYMSPVFKTMFESDFTENHTGIVKLSGKQLADVLRFLMTSHPGDRLKITEENVLQLIPLVEEYQVEILRKRCTKILQRELTKISNPIPLERVSRVLEIVKLLLVYSDAYKDVMIKALNVLTTCNGKYLLGAVPVPGPVPVPQNGFSFGLGTVRHHTVDSKEDKKKQVTDVLNSCKDLFRSLPKNTQQNLLEARICAIKKTPTY